jgi:hypothetical protein
MANLSIHWGINNDMAVILSELRSSTMAAGVYLNNSAGVTSDLWKATSTGTVGNRILTGRSLNYLAGSNGTYRCVIQSTDHTMTLGTRGMVVVTLSSGGLNGEWRQLFNVQPRGTT